MRLFYWSLYSHAILNETIILRFLSDRISGSSTYDSIAYTLRWITELYSNAFNLISNHNRATHSPQCHLTPNVKRFAKNNFLHLFVQISDLCSDKYGSPISDLISHLRHTSLHEPFTLKETECYFCNKHNRQTRFCGRSWLDAQIVYTS